MLQRTEHTTIRSHKSYLSKPNYPLSLCDESGFVLKTVIKTIQSMYVQCNIQARSRNHSRSGKAMSIACSKYVCVALGIQHAMRVRHIVICGLPSSINSPPPPHYLINGTIFENIYKNSVALVRERTIPTERPPPVGEVSANFCG